ncbi:alpha/beta fold hydrolase [Planomicrobium sp. CPCC 101110]|uniref:alpha/beta fold hydrolase n=1 Tax=Planomicrobium sp. CPCC 101110 TaxID=2599619 RepID=UPI0011B63304|nr:alpha/beta hydrolase [Planomicrobium sp. CPCC 101110]TWT23890.1 alpha/beta hydrolase [Planomicrobium sp. CPCC 101110]
MEHLYVQANGITLHTVVAGPEDGPLVLLLHGFPEFWRGWDKQIGPLAEKGYRVAVPDLRGYNLSDKPKGIENYTLDLLRDDVVGLIEHFGETSAIVIGHDWGGAVAWHLAATKPQYVEKLIAVNIPHPKAMPQVLAKNPAQWIKSSYIAFFQVPELPEKILATDYFKTMVGSLVSTSNPDTFSAEELEAYREAWAKPGALTAMLNWYRAIREGSVAQVPNHKITVPVRIIWGLGDQFLTPLLAKESLEFCEDADLVFVGEATHWIHHEQPYILNLLIDRFLTEKKSEAL